MQRKSLTDLSDIIIDEIAEMGFKLPVDFYGNWQWLEKEITFEGNMYLIGAFVRRDEITKALEICQPECLSKQ